jgi:hypothetical protein
MSHQPDLLQGHAQLILVTRNAFMINYGACHQPDPETQARAPFNLEFTWLGG